MKKTLTILTVTILISCSKKNDNELSLYQFPLEGNWKTTPYRPSDFIDTDTYEEIYFSKEFYYLCGELGIRKPSRYLLRNDSVFINNGVFYFKLNQVFEDSILVEFDNLERYTLTRLETDEFMFNNLLIGDEEQERIYLGMLRRLQKSKAE